jgi:flagellar hook-basal body complex protein FliE
MVQGVTGLTGLGNASGIGSAVDRAGGASGPKDSNFSDVLRKSIDEVSRLQQDASRAVEDLATQKTDDVAGVMTAVEKADMAFKMLLAIRSKLMDAYEEIKSIQM